MKKVARMRQNVIANKLNLYAIIEPPFTTAVFRLLVTKKLHTCAIDPFKTSILNWFIAHVWKNL